MRLRWVITALVLATLVAAPALHGATNTVLVCAAAKRRAVGKKALDRMKCEATGAIRGAVDPRCLQQAEERFGRAFAYDGTAVWAEAEVGEPVGNGHVEQPGSHR